jgi:hypothetical protein
LAHKPIGPRPAKPQQPAKADDEPAPRRKRAATGRSTTRAELLRRTFALDVLECPACKGRMKLVAMITEPSNIARFLTDRPEDALHTLNDASAPRDRPIGAALLLRIAGRPEAQGRIRVAAEATADDELRAALERAAEDALDETSPARTQR